MVTYEEIKKRIQLLRKVSEGDEVLYTDPHEIAEIMLEIIEYIEERGWTHPLIPTVRSICEELLTTKALDFVSSDLWRKMAQAIRVLFQISKEIKFTIWVEKVEGEYGGGYVNAQGKIYLWDLEGGNGGGYGEGHHGTGYIWELEGSNGGGYVNAT